MTDMLVRRLLSGVIVAGALILTSCTAEPADDEPDSVARTGAAHARGDRAARPEQPAPTICRGRLGAIDVPADLIVPENKTCRLEGTAIGGRTTVSFRASLLSRDSRFGEGISAHSFDRIVLSGGRAEGRPRNWYYDDPITYGRQVDFVFSAGRSLTIEYGPEYGMYYLMENSGRVEVTGLGLDVGRIYCQGNTRKPVVRRVSSENPRALSGQCAGNSGYGDTDF